MFRPIAFFQVHRTEVGSVSKYCEVLMECDSRGEVLKKRIIVLICGDEVLQEITTFMYRNWGN